MFFPACCTCERRTKALITYDKYSMIEHSGTEVMRDVGRPDPYRCRPRHDKWIRDNNEGVRRAELAWTEEGRGREKKERQEVSTRARTYACGSRVVDHSEDEDVPALIGIQGYTCACVRCALAAAIASARCVVCTCERGGHRGMSLTTRCLLTSAPFFPK